MGKLDDFIYNRRKAVIILCSILTVLGAILFTQVGINYNMMDYLPENANSTKAITKLEEEFQQSVPNLYVMVEGVTLGEAKDIKNEIVNADHVQEVLWLDDIADLRIPLETQDGGMIEGYYKDGDALYTVTVENGKEQPAIASIREAVGRPCKIAGTAADQAEAQALSSNEAAKAMVLLIPIIILILVLATTSWVEPVLYLLTLAAAVLLNLGSNIVFGEVSFVTMAAAPVLQIAVSLDYAVFLSHSFSEFKSKGMELKGAMRFAMRSAGKSISASMLTTLFGFIALLFMQFKIGSDMGISLVKGVLLSFFCVMTFLPALLLCCSKWIDKTKHRRFLPKFHTLGNMIMKVHIPAALLIAIIAVPCFLAQEKNTFFYGTTEKVEKGTEAYEIEQKFGKMNSLVIMVPRGESEKEARLSAGLTNLDHVTAVVSYAETVGNKIPSGFLSQEIAGQFYSEQYARFILSIDCEYEGQEAFTLVEQVWNLTTEYYDGDIYICGQSANMYDLKNTVQKDNGVVNLITLASIYLVLVFMTHSFIMPIPLILTIKCSIWLNMSVPYFMGGNLNYLGYLIVSTVQMGATVDYAILLTNTYEENRLTLNKVDAMKKTLSDIFESIIVSGMTLTLAGMCLNWSSSNTIVKVVGVLIGRGAILAILMVMLLLPALMVIPDQLISRSVWGSKRKERVKHETD